MMSCEDKLTGRPDTEPRKASRTRGKSVRDVRFILVFCLVWRRLVDWDDWDDWRKLCTVLSRAKVRELQRDQTLN